VLHICGLRPFALTSPMPAEGAGIAGGRLFPVPTRPLSLTLPPLAGVGRVGARGRRMAMLVLTDRPIETSRSGRSALVSGEPPQSFGQANVRAVVAGGCGCRGRWWRSLTVVAARLCASAPLPTLPRMRGRVRGGGADRRNPIPLSLIRATWPMNRPTPCSLREREVAGALSRGRVPNQGKSRPRPRAI